MSRLRSCFASRNSHSAQDDRAVVGMKESNGSSAFRIPNSVILSEVVARKASGNAVEGPRVRLLLAMPLKGIPPAQPAS